MIPDPIPYILHHFLSREISTKQAQEVWDWLLSNSNTVIVDELELAIEARHGWKERP